MSDRFSNASGDLTLLEPGPAQSSPIEFAVAAAK